MPSSGLPRDLLDSLFFSFPASHLLENRHLDRHNSRLRQDLPLRLVHTAKGILGRPKRPVRRTGRFRRPPVGPECRLAAESAGCSLELCCASVVFTFQPPKRGASLPWAARGCQSGRLPRRRFFRRGSLAWTSLVMHTSTGDEKMGTQRVHDRRSENQNYARGGVGPRFLSTAVVVLITRACSDVLGDKEDSSVQVHPSGKSTRRCGSASARPE